MAYATGTTYYNLPQTVDSDRRTWDDTNKAFADVDAALHSAVENIQDIDSLKTQVETNTSDITALKTSVETNTTDIASNKTAIETNATNISANESDISANKTLIDNLAQSITGNVEATTTASKAYDVGDYLIMSGKLYAVTATIGLGSEIVSGTNVEATNVIAAIAAAVSNMVKYSESGEGLTSAQYSKLFVND